MPQVEEAFGQLPPNISEFDHCSPAEHLSSKGEQRDWPGLSVALDQFERLFVDLNRLFPSTLAMSGNAPEVVVLRGRDAITRK